MTTPDHSRVHLNQFTRTTAANTQDNQADIPRPPYSSGINTRAATYMDHPNQQQRAT